MPEFNELPTLMLASSIKSRSANDAINDRAMREPAFNRSVTPVDFDSPTPFLARGVQTEIYADPEPTPRKSFSFGGLFRTPSQSTWKMSHSTSARKTNASHGGLNSRRVVSAPHSSKTQHVAPSGFTASDHRVQSGTMQSGSGRQARSPTERTTPSAQQAIPSSPLPPLNRLSAFEIDLPGSAPSYPASPQQQASAPSPRSSRLHLLPHPRH